MLHLPEQSPRTAVIVGIDPGSDKLGFCTITFDIETMQIVKTTARTLVGSKLMPSHSWAAELHGDRLVRIVALKEAIIELLREANPIQITIESPFYNSKRPMAFQALVQVLTALTEAVIEYDVWKTPFLIDPPTVKKAVGAAGNADKFKVRDSVLALPNLFFEGPVPLEEIDEHSIDAIAVAYARLKELIK